MTLRCTLDGLMLHAEMRPGTRRLVAFDGDEPFCMEVVEARFYELVSASWDELLRLQRAGYRFLRHAPDFRLASA